MFSNLSVIAEKNLYGFTFGNLGEICLLLYLDARHGGIFPKIQPSPVQFARLSLPLTKFRLTARKAKVIYKFATL